MPLATLSSRFVHSQTERPSIWAFKQTYTSLISPDVCNCTRTHKVVGYPPFEWKWGSGSREGTSQIRGLEQMIWFFTHISALLWESIVRTLEDVWTCCSMSLIPKASSPPEGWAKRSGNVGKAMIGRVIKYLSSLVVSSRLVVRAGCFLLSQLSTIHKQSCPKLLKKRYYFIRCDQECVCSLGLWLNKIFSQPMRICGNFSFRQSAISPWLKRFSHKRNGAAV